MAKKQQPPPPKKPKELEAVVRAVLEQQLSDEDLRQQLETLTAESAFNGLTYLWGPALYRRSRVMFRPFILNHFATMFQTIWDWKPVLWKDHAQALDAWLEEVERRGDVELFRRLYPWKHSQRAWGGLNDKQWRKDLLDGFKTAKEHYERNQVLNKFDFPTVALDESTALALYEIDPKAARPFILKHPPGPTWGHRRLPEKLCAAALQQGDDTLYFALYRQMVPLKTWEKDVAGLAKKIAEPQRLLEELEKRHPPAASGLDLSKGMFGLAQARGREVVPFLMKYLGSLWSTPFWGGSSQQNKLREHAHQHGWWDVWSVLVRKGDNDSYNKEVLALVADRSRPEEEIFHRLVRLSGASGEWTWGRFAWQQIQHLKDKTATALYQRFPELLRGPFRKHLTLVGFNTDHLANLLAVVLKQEDPVLIDYLASQVVQAGQHKYVGRPEKAVERLLSYFDGLQTDPVVFARRVASVLGQVPASGIGIHYKMLLKNNALARLFFESSPAALLQDPRSVRDLLEAAEIQAQVLALRVLAQPEERARQLAAANLDLLQAALLRPMNRRARLLAFQALANAATTLENARRILTRARQALSLPDKKYPREQLLSLIAQLCHSWPELRRATEQPVVYRGKAQP